MIIKSSRGKPRFNYIYLAHRGSWYLNTKPGIPHWARKGILTCFWFHGGAASKSKLVHSSAILDYLILEAGISLQFIGDSLKCIHLWGGMPYLMGSLTMALPCRLGCGQVEKIQEAYALWGPLSRHMRRGGLMLCVFLSAEAKASCWNAGCSWQAKKVGHHPT